MDDKEQVVKHLEITQGVINRLASNSFSIKSWSMAIMSAAVLFINQNNNVYSYNLILAFDPCFWFLVAGWVFLMAREIV